MNKFIAVKSALVMNGVPSESDWTEVGTQLASQYNNINWHIGDLIKFGEAQLGDDIYQHVSDIPPDHIQRCLNVAIAFPIGERFEGLTWWHHLAVLGLNPSLRKAMLTRAERDKMDVEDLRLSVKTLKGLGS